ncbi:hypothetical protein BD410DRAFT_51445 [Rickenella mellea]|uniref:Fe2OG dioxygenase domain-containing protein n=1 Tax=Rickenella mellea TaxID=50990 RepID=A0A4R5XFX1_9AGAM|nr:hypothetical protein BD410DRAFT_51445 [Rickenella mellea]
MVELDRGGGQSRHCDLASIHTSEEALDLSMHLNESQVPSMSIITSQTNISEELNDHHSDGSDCNSLFDEPADISCMHSPVEPSSSSSRFFSQTEECRQIGGHGMAAAERSSPPIPGLYFDPFLEIPYDLAQNLWNSCMNMYFSDNDGTNQIMLFERCYPQHDSTSHQRVDTLQSGSSPAGSGLPLFLRDLLRTLSPLLAPILPSATHSLLFPPPTAAPRARQVILNLYNPGEGITPHVDLLRRFGDGIIGVSLGSGCVMRFGRVHDEERLSETVLPDNGEGGDVEAPADVHDVFLPERSVIVLTEDARYRWTHGIDGRKHDIVKTLGADGVERIARGVRLSITFRWLLDGANVVGHSD